MALPQASANAVYTPVYADIHVIQAFFHGCAVIRTYCVSTLIWYNAELITSMSF